MLVTTNQNQDVDVIAKQETLDGLSVAINQSKSELELVNSLKDEAGKELDSLKKKLDDGVLAVSSRLESINKKLVEKQNALRDIEGKKSDTEREYEALRDDFFSLDYQFSYKSEKIKSDIAELEVTSSTNLIAIQNSLKEETSQNKLLTIRNKNLMEENKVLEDSIVSKKNDVTSLDKSIISREHKALALDERIEVNSEQLESLTKNSDEVTESIRLNSELLSGLKSDISSLKLEKDSLTVEVGAMTEQVAQFSREKLAFQSDKSMILLKEQFIKDKYEQAGIAYK